MKIELQLLLLLINTTQRCKSKVIYRKFHSIFLFIEITLHWLQFDTRYLQGIISNYKRQERIGSNLPDSLFFVQHYISLQHQLSSQIVPIPVENNILEVICTNSNFDWLWSVIKCPAKQ